MRILCTTLQLLLVASPLAAQQDSIARVLLGQLGPVGDIADWLVRYDRVAWISSDSVMASNPALHAELGSEWFCDTTGGLWHAFYGRFDAVTDRYRFVFHFVAGDGRPLRSSAVPIDSSRLTGVARALYNTRLRLPPPFAESPVRLNWFVQRFPGNGIGVTFLPAYQENGYLVFGGEGHFLWDSTGRTLLDSTYFFTGFRGVRPDSSVEVMIPADDLEHPTVGQLFFVLNYHTSFRKIWIRTRYGLTTVVIGPDGQPAWITSVREPEEPKTPS